MDASTTTHVYDQNVSVLEILQEQVCCNTQVNYVDVKPFQTQNICCSFRPYQLSSLKPLLKALYQKVHSLQTVEMLFQSQDLLQQLMV